MSLLSDAWAMTRASDAPKRKPVAQKIERWESEPYRRLVAAMPCAWCDAEGRSQAAHINSLALGKGRALKPPDWAIFPLCADGPGERGCHWKYDQGPGLPGFSPKAALVETLAHWLLMGKIEVRIK